MKKLLALTVAGLLAVSSAAAAHTVWLIQEAGQPDVFWVMFGGHAGAIDPYEADRLKTVRAMDANGRDLAVTRSGGDDSLRLRVAGEPVMIAVHFDNGIHSRTGSGPSVRRPMNEVPGAISATNAVKYNKTIVRWGSAVLTRPAGQPFEVIPQSAEAPRAGRPMQVQVRIDGRPAAGVRIGRGEDTAEATTDANGIASFTPEGGFNKLWAGQRIPTPTNPAYTELSYEYFLGFNVQ